MVKFGDKTENMDKRGLPGSEFPGLKTQNKVLKTGACAVSLPARPNMADLSKNLDRVARQARAEQVCTVPQHTASHIYVSCTFAKKYGTALSNQRKGDEEWRQSTEDNRPAAAFTPSVPTTPSLANILFIHLTPWHKREKLQLPER